MRRVAAFLDEPGYCDVLLIISTSTKRQMRLFLRPTNGFGQRNSKARLIYKFVGTIQFIKNSANDP